MSLLFPLRIRGNGYVFHQKEMIKKADSRNKKVLNILLFFFEIPFSFIYMRFLFLYRYMTVIVHFCVTLTQ